jgi:hypothetical protein
MSCELHAEGAERKGFAQSKGEKKDGNSEQGTRKEEWLIS